MRRARHRPAAARCVQSVVSCHWKKSQPFIQRPFADASTLDLFSAGFTAQRGQDSLAQALYLFERPADGTPFRVIALDPASNRTGDVWHVWVEGIRPGQLYAYRVEGPYHPREGNRYNLHKLLLDPFATAISPMPSRDFRPARGYDPLASFPVTKM